MLYLHRNESPYPPSPLVVEYVDKYIEYLNRYDVVELREELISELEKYTGLPREYIEFYPGSSHPLTLMIALAKVKGIEVLMPHPTFHAIYPVLRGFKAPYRLVKLEENMELNSERFLRLVEGKLVYLANPNNPTSNLLVKDFDYIEKIAKKAKLVFIDEAYYEFSDFTVKDLVPELDNVVVVRSLSKAFSLAGARFGYVLASGKAMDLLNSLRIGFETPVITQAIALGALRDKAYMKEVVSRIKSTRDHVRLKLLEHGLWSPVSSTNFLFIRLNKPCRGVWNALKGHGVLTMCLELIEDLAEYANYLRVTIGKPEDMELFLEKLLDMSLDQSVA
ncbi:MAG: histidinol-phosphate transaminase [Desulfurococcaceae archaeon]